MTNLNPALIKTDTLCSLYLICPMDSHGRSLICKLSATAHPPVFSASVHCMICNHSLDLLLVYIAIRQAIVSDLFAEVIEGRDSRFGSCPLSSDLTFKVSIGLIH
jgi:hypothetical protein